MTNRNLDMVLDYLNENKEINIIEFIFESVQMDTFDNVFCEIDNFDILKIIENTIKKFISFIDRFIRFILDKIINMVDKNLQNIIKLYKSKKIIKENIYVGVNLPKFEVLYLATNILIEGITQFRGDERDIYEKICKGEISKVSGFAREMNMDDKEVVDCTFIKNDFNLYIKRSQVLKNKLKEYKKVLESVRNNAKKDLDKIILSNKLGLNKVDDIIMRRYESLLSNDNKRIDNLEIFWKDLFSKIIEYQGLIIKTIKV